MKPFLALARADIAMYLSNRRALVVTLAAPILIAAFFGAVLGGAPKKPSRVPIAVVDQDGSAVSKRIVAAMKVDSTFLVEDTDEPGAVELVRKGKARAGVVFGPGFGDAAAKALFRPGAKKPGITVHYDPSQAVTLSLVKGLLSQHVMGAVSTAAFGPDATGRVMGETRRDVEASSDMDERTRRDLLALFDSVERIQAREGNAGAGAMPGFTMPFETREVEATAGANRRYNAYAHSFAGMGVQFVLFMGIEFGIAVLLMRRTGIWKRLRAAPVTRATLLGSRIVSGSAIAAILMAGIYAAAIAGFGVRIEGSIAGFAGVLLAFSLFTATFGLLIAAVGRTPEATRGIAIVATLVLVMLGGAWVPTFVFPEWLQSATLVVPTRWAIDGLEAMTWRGSGFDAALAPIGVMLAFSAAFAAIAVKAFNWEE
ncbi:MAG: ABC transporter permease [Betaproteobacteria bacterium]|nr:ABC transporter permease [Betaproteobacteria bacterium]